MTSHTTPTVALALGGGSARGLAHILMLEALDDLGVRPTAIAGTSIGAIVGALYAAGMTGIEIRGFAETLLGTRTALFRRLAGSLEGLTNLWSPRTPSVVDGVTLFELLMPPGLRCDFPALAIPFKAVTADYHAMSEHVVEYGAVIPAVAASAALPSLMRPVRIGGRVLIDGGFVNPTPWDVVAPLADVTVAVDVTGVVQGSPADPLPSAFDAWSGAMQIMFQAIQREKARRRPADVLVRPAVGAFTTLDFLKFREIFAAAGPARDAMKRELAARLAG